MDAQEDPVEAYASQREQLELQAFRAVAGGEYVRSRILHGLSLGEPSVASTAYLIKSRVKRADSLVLKVLDRQQKDPEYSALWARDIVGLRLLTLFRNELPVLVRRFLDFVLLSHEGSTGIFSGSSLRDSVAEIKIYGLNSRIDPNMDLCVREFVDYGFHLARNGETEPDDPTAIQIDRKDSQYSSIHIVLWAKGPTGYEHDIVPVEVQLRTSLEDVWGEIDHRAVYKAKQIQKLQLHAAESGRELQGLRRRIKNLKGLLDACSSAADDIELDLAQGGTGDIVSSYKAFTSVGIGKLNEVSLPKHVQMICANAVGALDEFYGLVRAHRSGEPISSMDLWFSLLARGTELLEEAERELNADRDTEPEALFRVKMELGLAYYWQAVILKQYPRPPEQRRGLAEGWHHAIRRAIGVYVNLVTSNRHSTRAALFFRLGNALSFQRSYETSLLHYKSSYDLLRTDESVPSNDYLRLRIPRQYGFALWNEGSRLEQQALDLGSRGLYHSREKQFYIDAIRVTWPVYKFEFTKGEFDMSAHSPEDEAKITANNVLDYLICLQECGGSLDDLSSLSIDKTNILEMLHLLSGESPESISLITFADTARKTNLFIGEYAEAVRCARRVLELSHTRDLSVPLSEFHYDKMLREASQTIADYGSFLQTGE
jgi:ppGpp synthetase/RelA/SpoT-type nucleotidyltranferase